MGTITAEQIYQQAAEILQDVLYATYSQTQLGAWVNDAQRAISIARPDANVSIENFLLSPGVSRQTLPATANRLGGLIRNMGTDGLTPGRGITGPVPREPLDAVLPLWTVTTGAFVKQYVYDEDTPLVFYVYPPVSGAWYVEAKFFKIPVNVTLPSSTIDLPDIYAPVIREWILYCAFARDSERTPNWVRAARHLTNFYQLLGVKTNSDLAVSPKILEQGKQLLVAGGG